MRVTPGPAPITGPHAQIGTPVRSAGRTAAALLALAAFGLYWLSSFILEARNGTTQFGADTPLYAMLAEGNAVDRVARFHPMTTVLTVIWMKIVGPLTPWVTAHHLLKAMFAAVGAVGVWAAMSAFSAVVPRRYAALWGVIYATSLGVWYFSSIEESKIVSATLSALYIATYLHLRTRWTMRGAVLLTVILLLACLNEIVAGFLVIIPVVDSLVQRGWDLRHGRWIALHALTAPVALLFLELVVNGWLVPTGPDPEGSSHLSMLWYYVLDNDFSAATAYSFLVNWLFFNIAAPTRDASFVFPQWPDNKAYFEPVLTNYLSSPVSAGLVVLFGVMLAASLLPRYRSESANNLAGVFLALLTYALLRGVFFFVFNPYEAILFSPSATLAHLLMIGIPFETSTFPAKQGVLAVLAVLVFVTNGAFMVGR